MDRNSIIGLLLIGAALVGYSIFSAPSKEEIAKEQHRRDSIAELQLVRQQDSLRAISKVQAATAVDTAKTASVANDSTVAKAAKDQLGIFAGASKGTSQYYTLENEVLKVKVSSEGGRIASVQLKKYNKYDGTPVQLVSPDSSSFGLGFFAQNRNIDTRQLQFVKVDGVNNPYQLTMRLATDDPAKYIDYIYTLKANTYDVDFSLRFVGMDNVIAANTGFVNLFWNNTLQRQEKSLTNERNAATSYYAFTDGEVDYLSETSADAKALKTKVKWVSFKQQYFTSIAIAKDAFDNANVETAIPTDSTVKYLKAEFSVAYNHKPVEQFDMQFYYGPNLYKELSKYDLNLEKQIPLGPAIFSWVNKYFVIHVFHFLEGFNLNYGIIILLLTLLIKLILSPFTWRSYLSQARMRLLKPEMDEIDKKHNGDAMKSQQEKMALFKKAGVSPFGGCLPMLLQLPVLIALFRFFPSSIELRQQAFLWCPDLSSYDSILNLGFNIPFYGDHVSLFNLLMFVSTLLYTRLNSANFTGSGPQAKQMKVLAYMMPAIFFFTFNSQPAGLCYYYFLANMFTFLQQFLMKKIVNEDQLHAKIQENKKKPVDMKKSAFQKRLEDMAKQRGYKLPNK